jgi:hypothetical protein
VEVQPVQLQLQARLLLLISRATDHLLQVPLQQPYLMLRHSNSALREPPQLQQPLQLVERQQQWLPQVVAPPQQQQQLRQQVHLLQPVKRRGV